MLFEISGDQFSVFVFVLFLLKWMIFGLDFFKRGFECVYKQVCLGVVNYFIWFERLLLLFVEERWVYLNINIFKYLENYIKVLFEWLIQ